MSKQEQEHDHSEKETGRQGKMLRHATLKTATPCCRNYTCRLGIDIVAMDRCAGFVEVRPVAGKYGLAQESVTVRKKLNPPAGLAISLEERRTEAAVLMWRFIQQGGPGQEVEHIEDAF